MCSQVTNWVTTPMGLIQPGTDCLRADWAPLRTEGLSAINWMHPVASYSSGWRRCWLVRASLYREYGTQGVDRYHDRRPVNKTVSRAGGGQVRLADTYRGQ